MASSRSKFYVDTPLSRDPPSQRHSMFVSHSEVDPNPRPDLSSASSSTTLPSTAGSVDRLTGLGSEKKTPRFFTLKPKTSFSLRPFFSSTSIPSLSPSNKKHRKSAALRRDSCVQTDEDERAYDEVGVQTLNASTVDVPVQTCFREWEEDDKYSYRRSFTRPAFPSFPSVGYYSSSSTAPVPKSAKIGLENPSGAKNSVVAPLVSSKLLKYAAPDDTSLSEKTLSTAGTSKDVNNGGAEISVEAASTVSTPLPEGVSVKYFSAKELTPQNNLSPKPLLDDSAAVPSPIVPAADNQSQVSNLKESSNLQQTETASKSLNPAVELNAIPTIDDTIHKTDEQPEVSAKIIVVSQCVDRPPSALKVERTDSPVKHSAKIKTVHFDLSDADQVETVPKIDNRSLQSRNLDKDFEALLRDLDILTDDPPDNSSNNSNEENLKISFKSVPEGPPKQTLLSTKLKSAFDVLHLEVLPPILETFNESYESDPQISSSLNESKSDTIETNSESDSKANAHPSNSIIYTVDDSQESECPPPTFKPVEDENKLEVLNHDSTKSTSPDVFTDLNLDINVKSDSNCENVYDIVIEENTCRPVPLPTLPSFFDSSLKISKPKSVRVERDGVNPLAFATLLESDSEEKMLSRSSSRSSIRSNPRSEFEILLDSAKKFESCENLDQLEEEIIKSLCEPNSNEFEAVRVCTPIVSKSFEVQSSDSALMRRAILDRLFSGENTTDYTNNGYNSDKNDSSSQNKHSSRPGKKHVATLTKFEHVDNVASLESIYLPDNKHPYYSFELPTNSLPNKSPCANLEFGDKTNILNQPVASPVLTCSFKREIESPKKVSMFLFPENNSPNPGVPEYSTACVTKDSLKDKDLSGSYLNNSSAFQNLPNTNRQDISASSSRIDDSDSETCDSTHCLRPSEIQSSPFIAKINSGSMTSRPSPEKLYPQSTASENKVFGSNSEVRDPKNLPNVQCDYANCLKPSQVQNSIFTAELSEITSNKSLNYGSNTLRINSPLTARTNSPIQMKPVVSVPMMPDTKRVLKVEKPDEVSHKSEVTITLKTPQQDTFLKTSDGDSQAREFGHSQTEAGIVELSPIHSVKKELHLEPFSENSVPQTPTLSLSKDNSSEPMSSVIPPPPPPPPPAGFKSNLPLNNNACPSLESMIRNQHSNLVQCATSDEPNSTANKNPVMVELEQRLQTNRRHSLEELDLEMNRSKKSNVEFRPVTSPVHRAETQGEKPSVSPTSYNATTYQCNGSNCFSHGRQENGHKDHKFNRNGQSFSSKTIVTDEPPPPGAVLLDKKVIVEGDKVHTDKYYAIPVKEVLKETTTTTKFIPAPPKYEGIGPTEDGVPIGLRNSVKKENMHNWYKTMFKSLHKADSSNDSQEYIIGYSSEPETSKKDKTTRKKSSTLDNRSGLYNAPKTSENLYRQGYRPSAKSSIEVYNVRPRLIEDYEPGQSSVTDDEISYGSKRYLPPLNTPKSSYEFKNGYEQDNNFIRNLSPTEGFDPEQQKVWYKEIQKGGDIPQFGLGKSAPEKPREPVIGPLPPPPLNYHGPTIVQQATRPLTLPANYYTDNGLCQQSNGPYEIQMRHAIHSEIQHRVSPSSSQLSSPSRSILKSPSRSPDLKLPARALFDFRPESSKEISLKKGDLVLILRQLDKNWYEGERHGCIGIFPISYVEIVPPEHTSTPIKSFTEGIGKVLYEFTAQTSIELPVRKGDTVNLLRKVDSNWYEARFNNKKGIIPASYLQVLQEPSDRNANSLSPKPCLRSPVSSSESRNGFSKTNSTSLSPYMTNNTSPLMENGRGKFQGRGKKGTSLIEPVMYRALYSYSPQNTDELELLEGDTICVVEMCDDGWYVGTSVRTGIFGIFPGNYVEKV